jgi:hypothetical protein
MADVVSIEVDGEPGEPRFDTSRGRPAWGMPVAIVVVGALMLAVGWTVMHSGGGSTASSAVPSVSTPTTTRATPASTEAPLVQGGASTTIPAASTATTVPASDMHDPVEAARTALAAWGDFAVTGDLARVRLVFSAGGPQLTQLEDEAARITGPADTSVPRYLVTLTGPRSDVASDTATVTGTVVWSRVAESDQAYRWAIEMHLDADGTWRLFTVRTVVA